MVEEVGERCSILGADSQTRSGVKTIISKKFRELSFLDFIPYQALTRQRDFVEVDFEVELGVADLLIPLEWDVAADHVIKEDAQGPHGHGLVVIATLLDPLWRGVHPRAVKLRVVVILHEGSAPKVDQIQLSSFEIHEDVFIFDVSVDDPGGVAGEDCLDHLAEEVGRHLLVQAALLTDVVEHVLARVGPLHHNDIGVNSFEKIKDFHSSLNILNGQHQCNF